MSAATIRRRAHHCTRSGSPCWPQSPHRHRRRRPTIARSVSRDILAHGRRLRVDVRPGDGSRTPLLLCNGIGARLELLQPFVDALADDLEVIRFDVPGVGGSPAPRMPYRLSTVASALAAVLDELGHDRADVLGISWGGALAQQFASQYRTRCRRLVLVATSPGVLSVPAHPRVLSRMLTPRRHRDASYAGRVAGEIYGGTLRADPQRVTELMGAGHSTASRGYGYQLAAVTGWTSLPLLPFLRQPTLILAGDDDPIIPLVNAKLMHRLLPSSELRVYPGGHLSLISEAAEHAPVIERFLSHGQAKPRRIPAADRPRVRARHRLQRWWRARISPRRARARSVRRP